MKGSNHGIILPFSGTADYGKNMKTYTFDH
jgi:hypothetical protein